MSTMLGRLIPQPSRRRLPTSLQSSLSTIKTRHLNSSLSYSSSLFPLQSWVWLLASAFTPSPPKAVICCDNNLYLDCLANQEHRFVTSLCCFADLDSSSNRNMFVLSSFPPNSMLLLVGYLYCNLLSFILFNIAYIDNVSSVINNILDSEIC